MARVGSKSRSFPSDLGAENFVVEDVLDANVCGVAFKAYWKGSDIRVALKLCFRVNAAEQMRAPVSFQREFDVLTTNLSSGHPNVGRVEATFVDTATEEMVAAIKSRHPSLANKIQKVNPRTGLQRSTRFQFFVTELLPRLDDVVLTQVETHSDHLSTEFVVKTALGVANALHFSESYRAVHLSVTPRNVSITLDKEGMPDRVVLQDWGHSILVPGRGPLVRTFSDTLETGLRSDFNLAPEIQEKMVEMRTEASRGDGRPMEVDFSFQSSYSIGSLLVDLMCAAVSSRRHDAPASFPKTLRDLMVRALDPDPKRRPALADIMHQLRKLLKTTEGASSKKPTTAATTLGGGGGGGGSGVTEHMYV
jgi:hypothetical protein